eukprot:4422899-Alexandrium_andersonii.AAC.1
MVDFISWMRRSTMPARVRRACITPLDGSEPASTRAMPNLSHSPAMSVPVNAPSWPTVRNSIGPKKCTQFVIKT